jgi:toxin YoeB
VKLIFAEKAWEDDWYWQKTDKKMVNRIHALKGIGKPEPLKHALSGYWSRRINDEHRIVYRIVDGAILIAQLRYHY